MAISKDWGKVVEEWQLVVTKQQQDELSSMLVKADPTSRILSVITFLQMRRRVHRSQIRGGLIALATFH